MMQWKRLQITGSHIKSRDINVIVCSGSITYYEDPIVMTVASINDNRLLYYA